MSGTLFVVATPIGNLEDLTPRARQTLAEVSLIAAEDTRHTGRLLMHIGCKTRLMALHDHNEEKAVGRIIRMLMDGENIALVSDAGTPLVSDPGFRVVRAAHEAGIPVSPIPGASAVTAALSAAGIPTDRFCFEGFAPSKPVARKERVQQLIQAISDSGGQYFDARNKAQLETAYTTIDQIEKGVFVQKTLETNVPYYQIFLLSSLTLLFVGLALNSIPYFVEIS